MTDANDMLRRRETFRAWTRVTVRYNDLDTLGHVNNAAMPIFLEQARCEIIVPLLKQSGRHLDLVLAATSLQYLEEMRYPGTVEIGSIAVRVGSKSFTLRHGVFQDGVCAGTGEVVLVTFDVERRVSVEIPAQVRDLLESWMPPGTGTVTP